MLDTSITLLWLSSPQ